MNPAYQTGNEAKKETSIAENFGSIKETRYDLYIRIGKPKGKIIPAAAKMKEDRGSKQNGWINPVPCKDPWQATETTKRAWVGALAWKLNGGETEVGVCPYTTLSLHFPSYIMYDLSGGTRYVQLSIILWLFKQPFFVLYRKHVILHHIPIS